jgi:hypothetical protein
MLIGDDLAFGDRCCHSNAMCETNRQCLVLHTAGCRHQLTPHGITTFAIQRFTDGKIAFGNGYRIAPEAARTASWFLS